MTHPSDSDAGAIAHPSVDTLGDLADGVLGAAEHDMVARHVAGCGECAAELRAVRALLARAAALPREVEPPAELWAAVQARIAAREPAVVALPVLPVRGARRLWTLAAAAGLILAVGSTLASRAARVPLGRVSAPMPVALRSDIERTDAAYARAATELRAALDARRGTLAPATRASVEASLLVVDAAIAEARSALARDPGNLAIADVLSANHEQKLDLLRRATRLLSPS